MGETSYSLNVIDSMFFKTDASEIKIYIRKKKCLLKLLNLKAADQVIRMIDRVKNNLHLCGSHQNL